MIKILSLAIGGIIACVLLASCDQNKYIQPDTKRDYIDFKVQFRPAFTEASDIWLSKVNSIKFVQIFILDQSWGGNTQDIFLFKKLYLTDQQYLTLDTSVIKLGWKEMGYEKDKVVDGMPIKSILHNNEDLNIIYRNAPCKKADSAAYLYVKALLENFKLIFQDSLITEYFNDLESYIDESRFKKADPRRKIDQLRMMKYHWTIMEKPLYSR